MAASIDGIVTETCRSWPSLAGDRSVMHCEDSTFCAASYVNVLSGIESRSCMTSLIWPPPSLFSRWASPPTFLIRQVVLPTFLIRQVDLPSREEERGDDIRRVRVKATECACAAIVL